MTVGREGHATIVCEQCGTRNDEGESFCGQCGTYLEWEGQPERAREQQAPPAAAPLIPAPTAPEPAPDPAPVESPQPPGDREASSRAASLVAPLPAPERPEPSAGPAPVRPAEPVQHPPRRQMGDDPPPAPGDLICGQCGAGNVTTRHFSAGAVLRSLRRSWSRSPWWRRIFGRRPRQQYEAELPPAPQGPQIVAPPGDQPLRGARPGVRRARQHDAHRARLQRRARPLQRSLTCNSGKRLRQ